MECYVLGCASCVEGNPSSCIECKDEENAEMVDGECSCKESNHVFSEDGYCIACQVLGCSECQLDDAGVCKQCFTGMSVQNGKCVCDDSTLKLNPNGECSFCDVIGCESCAVGDSGICVKCTDCSAALNGGECECPSVYGRDLSYLMDETGFCFL